MRPHFFASRPERLLATRWMLRECVAVCLLLATMAGTAWGQKPKDDFASLSQQAKQAQKNGNAEQAIRLYLQALKVKPEWPEGWMNVGMLLADRKDFERAKVAFENQLQLEPGSAEGWALLGMCEFEMDQTGKSLDHLRHGLSLGITNADLLIMAEYHEALLLIRQSDFETAHHQLELVVRSGADDPDVVVAMGMVALRLAEKPESLTADERSLAAQIGQIEANSNFQALPNTIKQYEDLAAKLPNAPGIHYALGNILISNGHYPEGIKEMQIELQHSPNDPMPLLQIAMTYLRTDKAEPALPFAQKAVEASPQLFASHYALGWALFKLHQYEKAIPELEKAVKLAPGSAQAHYSLSQAYQRTGHKEEADRERAIFIKLNEAGAEQTQKSAGKGMSGGENSTLPPARQ